MFNIDTITRPAIKAVKSYQVWRDGYLDVPGAVFLDNGENNEGSVLGRGYERYPSSSQRALREALAAYKDLSASQLALGNGSDELIDLLIRCFCEPGRDAILVCEPTFGMYRVYAQLNAVEVINVPLTLPDFSVNDTEILTKAGTNTRIIFVCSPNNPTGTSIDNAQLRKILQNFDGLVVVDEAYIDFSEKASALALLNETPNLVVLQTFSKAWGLASLRVGAAYGQEPVISVLNQVRPPFNVSGHSQEQLLKALQNAGKLPELISRVLSQKRQLQQALEAFSFVINILPGDANFLLIEVKDADRLCRYLLERQVLISNRSGLLNCANHVRISIGTEEENLRLIQLLNQFENT